MWSRNKTQKIKNIVGFELLSGGNENKNKFDRTINKFISVTKEQNQWK